MYIGTDFIDAVLDNSYIPEGDDWHDEMEDLTENGAMLIRLLPGSSDEEECVLTGQVRPCQECELVFKPSDWDDWSISDQQDFVDQSFTG